MAQRGGFRGGRNRTRSSPYSWKDRPHNPQRKPNWGQGKGDGEDAGQAQGQNQTQGTEPEQRASDGAISGSPVVGAERTTPGRAEKKFSNKARLFVGNLPRDFSEEQLRKLFEEHGEVQDVYVHREKSFGFVRMAYRVDAEKAIAALNGFVINKRDIKVRYAASNCSVKVSNLHPLVSNELLADSFSQFGEVESAIVCSDDRGKSLGYGVVDFARKNQATMTIQRCRNDHFLLTKTPVPVLVTEMVKDNDQDGVPEKSLVMNQSYHNERDVPPRFAHPGTLEYDIASRWKAHYEYEKQQREELEQRLKEARNQLQQELKGVAEQHQTLLLRQEIVRHQQEQMRLAEQLRKQEERLGMMAPGQPAPLFAPGTAPGEVTDQASAQDPSLMPPVMPGFHPPPQAPPFFPPPPLMGQ